MVLSPPSSCRRFALAAKVLNVDCWSRHDDRVIGTENVGTVWIEYHISIGLFHGHHGEHDDQHNGPKLNSL